jgi:hypothetical protein
VQPWAEDAACQAVREVVAEEDARGRARTTSNRLSVPAWAKTPAAGTAASDGIIGITGAEITARRPSARTVTSCHSASAMSAADPSTKIDVSVSGESFFAR